MRCLEHIHRVAWRGAALALAGAVLAAAACEDTPVRTARTIRLVTPLTMTWPFSDTGAPYPGGRAVFSAQAALRVNWTFRIRGVPARRDDPRTPRYKQEFAGQDRILFTWDGSNNTGLDNFAPGDSCVASVEFVQLDPADAEMARVVFVIGGR